MICELTDAKGAAHGFSDRIRGQGFGRSALFAG